MLFNSTALYFDFANMDNLSSGTLNFSGHSNASVSMNHSNQRLKMNSVVEKTLDLMLGAKKRREALTWVSINILLVSIILIDFRNRTFCPSNISIMWDYIEGAASIILGCSILYYAIIYIYYRFFYDTVTFNENQRRLLNVDKKDKSYIITQTPTSKKRDNSNGPVNISHLSWQNDSNNMSMNPQAAQAHWMYNSGNMSHSFNNSFSTQNSLTANQTFNCSANSFQTFKLNSSNIDHISNERSLQQYLNEISEQEKNLSSAMETQNNLNTINNANSFWNSYRLDDISTLLKTTLYQLSPSSTPQSKQASKEDGHLYTTTIGDGNSDVIRKICSAKLSNYVANLRMWIASTILERVVCEINKIDSAFQQRGFNDMKIGSVGLERLKKTAENQQLVQLHIPMLPMLIPFLELTTNQEYLVSRVKELAKGSCLANFKWNSGTTLSNSTIDEHIPSDSAIIFHLFCTYLDSQLFPLPDIPRPFYHRYVIIGDPKKSIKETINEVRNKTKCAILCTNPLKPKFNFISEERIHNCSQDRNNLFYVLIQFLIHMKNNHDGLLEGVNLGKSGINVMCCVED